MKKNSGQALIEFVLILPVILLILLYVIDFSKLAIAKESLESDMNLIVNLYYQNKTDEINNYINEKKLTIKYNQNDNLTNIEITKKIKYSMPLLKQIFGETILKTRTVYHEIEQ